MLTAIAGWSRPLPFVPGEKLVYEVRWERIPVAQVSLEIQPFQILQGQSAFHFVFQAKTKPAMDALYPVEGRIEAFSDRTLTRSLRLTKDMREGRSHRVYQVDFDWHSGIAVYESGERKLRRIILNEGTLDMISILYYARSLSLEEGVIISRPLNTGKKIRQVQARVMGTENVVVAGRPWAAYRIQVDVRKAGGVFKKSRKTALELWISSDTRKIPLKVESKVWVGSFTIEYIAAPSSPLRVTADDAG